MTEVGRGALAGGVAQVDPLFAPALTQRQDVRPGGQRRVVTTGIQLEEVAPRAVAHATDQREVGGGVRLLGPDPGGAALGVGDAVQDAVIAGGVLDRVGLTGQEQAVRRVGGGRDGLPVGQGKRQAAAVRAHAILRHTGRRRRRTDGGFFRRGGVGGVGARRQQPEGGGEHERGDRGVLQRGHGDCLGGRGKVRVAGLCTTTRAGANPGAAIDAAVP
ncbi:hypothetical protein G6F22_016131 [Rhizopus arrhizus]|nr:hypothetical protein G6F22_016131 [Rhizopus arrhizus]